MHAWINRNIDGWFCFWGMRDRWNAMGWKASSRSQYSSKFDVRDISKTSLQHVPIISTPQITTIRSRIVVLMLFGGNREISFLEGDRLDLRKCGTDILHVDDIIISILIILVQKFQ